jgi:ribose transport system permease protein
MNSNESAAMEVSEPQQSRFSTSRLGRLQIAQKYGMIAVLLLLIAVFAVLRPQTFPTLANAQSILNNQAVLIIISMAAMMGLIVGAFDLSIAATLSLSSALVIGLQGQGFPWPAAVAVSLSAGAAIGLVNGMLVVMKFNSFVVTLATSTIVGGLAMWFTGGQVLFADVDPSFISAGRGRLAGFVYPLYLTLVVVLILWYVLEHTPLGRKMYATGYNIEAARLTGLPTARLTVIGLVAGGVLAALAGVMQSAKIGSGQPDIGSVFLLPAFAAGFLGASAIRPGRFNPLGTVIGVYLVATGFTGLVLLGVEIWVQPIFYGLVLIIAIVAPKLAELLRARNDARTMLGTLRAAGRPARRISSDEKNQV